MMFYNQQPFDIKLEWGLQGIETLVPVSDVIIIVDVLSFSTCVEIATSRDAIIYPFLWKDERAISYAKTLGAELADFNRNANGYSLSPASLMNIKAGTVLVLPSPNGSTLSMATGSTPTLCGCLRNAKSVAEFAVSFGKRISIIPAGEQWTNNTLRPAFEDLLAAGAIVSHLPGTLSPESKVALSVYQNLKFNIFDEIVNCGSGKELIQRGFEEDVRLACQADASDTVPLLTDGSYFTPGNLDNDQRHKNTT